jgi:hypothetical protein
MKNVGSIISGLRGTCGAKGQVLELRGDWARAAFDVSTKVLFTLGWDMDRDEVIYSTWAKYFVRDYCHEVNPLRNIARRCGMAW